MKRIRYVTLAALLGCAGVVAVAACGDDDDIVGSPKPDAGLTDTSASASETSSPNNPDANTADANGSDTGVTDAGCPASWTALPDADPSLSPEGGANVIIHGQVLSGDGTQNYVCAPADDAGLTFKWTLVAPEAQLSDCKQQKIIHHFASDAGSTRPEWQTTDSSYVVGKRVAAYAPVGSTTPVPWLLLAADSHGGTGPIANTTFVQRLYTDGGSAPATGCALIADVDAGVKVPYTADYYFYAP